MICVESNGTHIRARRTILPTAPHPPGQGTCSEREPGADSAAAYAIEDEPRDTVEDIEQ